MKKINIRLMSFQDYKGVHNVDLEIQKEYAKFLGKNWSSFTKKRQLECLAVKKNEFKQYVEQKLSYVAEYEEKIVGFLLGLKVMHMCYVEHIATLKLHRRQNIGRSLYLEMFNQAKKNSIKKIIAYINTDNPDSIKFHKCLGFSLSERIEAVYQITSK